MGPLPDHRHKHELQAAGGESAVGSSSGGNGNREKTIIVPGPEALRVRRKACRRQQHVGRLPEASIRLLTARAWMHRTSRGDAPEVHR